MPEATDFRSSPEAELLGRADEILRGTVATQLEIYRLARALKGRWKRFGKARKLLWLARSPADHVKERNTETKFLRKLAQQHALCTHKDNDLSAYDRFDRALEILRTADLGDETDSSAVITQETLGIAGGICKGKWEAFGQRASLDQARAYYSRGWAQGSADDGYTGLNTAYLLDLIAFQEEAAALRSHSQSPQAGALHNQAREIREKLLLDLPSHLLSYTDELRKKSWTDPDLKEDHIDGLYWLRVTMGEACLGLGLEDDSRFQLAKESFSAAAELGRYDWMLESTARQLASLTRLLRRDSDAQAPPREWEAVECLLGGGAPGVRSAFIGKVGLALSGGGFRASLFHIGVLARLAEMDMLRHVEYLSCVSGGSIIGAYYYLAIRKLLQEKADCDITSADYVQVVRDAESNFLEGVQSNIRMQALSDFRTNLGHDIATGALPTERVADLYEQNLFSRIKDDGQRNFSSLTIAPLERNADGEPSPNTQFRPKDDNWRRNNKAPILVLNATTLNTGHNWQFTATWMGEPPSTVNNEIDSNRRLRRMYYTEAPDGCRQFRLARAVGASACVPTLFAPLEIQGLFAGQPVRLVDGGVHDNQGIASLLDQGCTTILVSDASGQLRDDADPSEQIWSTAFRADEIVQERVRVAQYQDLESRVRAGMLRALMFLHLKKELEQAPLDWIGCLDPHDASDEAKSAADRGVLTSYGVHREIQRKLASVRTDLDAFHCTEAYALMASGYQMAKNCFPKELEAAVNVDAAAQSWKFFQLLPRMRQGDQKLLSMLDRSSQRLFKIWDMSPVFRRLKVVLIVAAAVLFLAALAAGLMLTPPWEIVTTRSLAWWILGVIATAVGVRVLGERLTRTLAFRATLRKWAVRVSLAYLVARAARWYLAKANAAYLKAGNCE